MEGVPFRETILIACDVQYFKTWGIYCINSALLTDNPIHCHVVNPDNETISLLLSLNSNNFSYSYNKIDLSEYHALKKRSYYYVLRYFIAEFLFKHNFVDRLYICDTDVIFRKKLAINNYSLFISYNKNASSEWKKVGGNFLIISKLHSEFCGLLVNEINLELQSGKNYKEIATLGKIEKANLIGLDQVCVARTIEKYGYANKIDSIQEDIPIISKHFGVNSFIWTLTGGNKKDNLSVKEYLEKEYSIKK